MSKREYYYITELPESPYRLSVSGALHLGAVGQLHLYVYQAGPLRGAYTDHESETFDPAEDGAYLIIPRRTVAAMEQGYIRAEACGNEAMSAALSERHTLDHAYLDSRRYGPGPQEQGTVQPQPVWFTGHGAPPVLIRTSELLVFRHDLDELVRVGEIEDVSDSTTSLPNGLPHDLDFLFAAYRRFWNNDRVDCNDPDTHPVQEDVTKWLEDHDVAGWKAKAGASIIRPPWARQGAPAKK